MDRVTKKNIKLLLLLAGVLLLCTANMKNCGGGAGLLPDGNCDPDFPWPMDDACFACDSTNPTHPCFCDVTDSLKVCYDSCMMASDTCTDITTQCVVDTCGAGAACEDPRDSCFEPTVDYLSEIHPLWTQYGCDVGCHLLGATGWQNTGSVGPPIFDVAGLVLDNSQATQDTIIGLLVNQPTYLLPDEQPRWRVLPFEPDSSYLLTVLKAWTGQATPKTGGEAMPYAGTLAPVPDDKIALCSLWIWEGARASINE
ncbi:hypothetical protein ACFL5V_00905 [Fibrobacterota bacterium]